LPAGTDVKEINFFFGGQVVTGIDEIKAAFAKDGKTNGLIFDLSGRIVNNPTKGIYIINGKKVLIK
jgi:hypothetical protein